MPTYKYEAILPSRVIVFGIHDAESVSDLEEFLHRRQLQLVQFQALTLSPNLTQDCRELPRMVQLRIGERLREAVLSGLPTHKAIRAVAWEPFEHPLLMAMPWVLMLACFSSLVLLCLAMMVRELAFYGVVLAVILPVATLSLWSSISTFLIHRPRKALLRMATQIENGQMAGLETFETMSGEMGAVARSGLDERVKATSLADLVPSSTASHLRAHQFAGSLLGPLIVCCILFFGMHLFCLTVVPQIRETFISFGISLPWLTSFTFWISSIIESPGYPGLVINMVVSVTGLVLLYLFLISPKWAEVISGIPWLGISTRWLLQARIARMLSVLLRNNAEPVMAVQIAASSSGSPRVVREGEMISKLIQEGSVETAYSQLLSGLPLSMLFHVADRSSTEDDRQQVSHSFSLYADALERAASGNGVLLGIMVEFMALILSAMLIGFVLISFFLPMIQLMSSLS